MVPPPPLAVAYARAQRSTENGERNNQAVKKSREKTKLKTQQMMDRVTQLRSENDELEKNIETLTKELHLLKELFMSHAGSAHGVQVNEEELTRMLVEDPEVNEGVNLLLSLAKGPPPKARFQRVPLINQ